MVSGDLIVGEQWNINDGETFVGIDPLNPDTFITIEASGEPYTWRSSDTWFRITNPSMLCVHCDEPVGVMSTRWGSIWNHMDNDGSYTQSACRGLYAAPAEVTP